MKGHVGIYGNESQIDLRRRQHKTPTHRRARLKRDGTCAETRFGLSEKWTNPFKSAGESLQSTTGSRGVRISGQIMDRPCSEVQCGSSGYPLQSPISPSLLLPRVAVCHHVSNGLYIVCLVFFFISMKSAMQTQMLHSNENTLF